MTTIRAIVEADIVAVTGWDRWRVNELLLSGPRRTSYYVDPQGRRWFHPLDAAQALGITQAQWQRRAADHAIKALGG